MSEDGTVFTLNITNNLPGVPSTLTEFTFTDGCGEPVGGEPTDVLVTSDQTSVTITFSESQSNHDCTVAYSVVLPDGSSQTYTQEIGGTPEERLARAKAVFIDGSLTNYTDYLAGRVSRPDGGNVDPGNFVMNAVEGEVADAATEDDVSAAYSGQQVQDLLNRLASVEDALPGEPTTGLTSIMNAYSFSGTVTTTVGNVMSTQISFVIDLGDDNVAAVAALGFGAENQGNGRLATTTRLIKELSNGDWRGVDNGDGADGDVSYLSGIDTCPTEPVLGWLPTASTETAVDGLIPASQDAPVRCIMITITDNGVYDADTLDASGDPVVARRDGFISDPIVGVVDSPDIRLAHASGGGGGGLPGKVKIKVLLGGAVR